MTTTDGVIPYTTGVFSGPVDLNTAINFDNIQQKTILITGGASGFGAALFKQLASHGANVIIGDINVKGGEALVAEIRQKTNSSNHHFLPLDVTKWTSQATFFKDAARLSPHGGIDCVIANAGICDLAEIERFENPPDYSSMDDPPAPAMRTVDINLDGVLYTTTLAISYLSRNPGSRHCSLERTSDTRDRHLVLVSSIAGVVPLPGLSYYGAAKHGVVGLFRSLRATTPIKQGIRVNMVNPYFVDTPIIGTLGPLALAGGGLAKLEDVVGAITRLIADQSIIGRGLIVGPRATAEQVRNVGLGDIADTNNAAIWDLYGDDFRQSDVFTRRIIGLTNLVAKANGVSGIINDTLLVFKRLVQRLWFRRR